MKPLIFMSMLLPLLSIGPATYAETLMAAGSAIVTGAENEDAVKIRLFEKLTQDALKNSTTEMLYVQNEVLHNDAINTYGKTVKYEVVSRDISAYAFDGKKVTMSVTVETSPAAQQELTKIRSDKELLLSQLSEARATKEQSRHELAVKLIDNTNNAKLNIGEIVGLKSMADRGTNEMKEQIIKAAHKSSTKHFQIIGYKVSSPECTGNECRFYVQANLKMKGDFADYEIDSPVLVVQYNGMKFTSENIFSSSATKYSGLDTFQLARTDSIAAGCIRCAPYGFPVNQHGLLAYGVGSGLKMIDKYNKEYVVKVAINLPRELLTDDESLRVDIITANGNFH